MPFDTKLPSITGIMSAASKDAQTLINKTIIEATGGNFRDLSEPPPLGMVLRAYWGAMEVNVAEALKDMQDGAAERAARANGGHAAEILSPDGQHVGYTTYNDLKP